MKWLLSLALTAALALELVACSGQSQTADTPETAATPQAVETAETAAIPVAGDFYAIQPVIGMNTLFNAGDVFYELRPRSGYCLLFRIDCDTATRGVLCSVPGCTHDSDACPAWLPGQIWDYTTFATEDTVYVYKARSYEEVTDWDSYYEQNVASYLNDEDMLQGRTPQEFEISYYNRFVQLRQPACLYAVARDGSEQRRIDLSENLERNTALSWCDGTALYGCLSLDALDTPVQGFRVELATGQVTTFSMLAGEGIVAAEGRLLLTARVVSDVPFPDPQTEWEAYQAILQNATLECYSLDPASGKRKKLLELPGSLIAQNGDFSGIAGGQLYFLERQTQPEGDVLMTILAFDTTTGQQELEYHLPRKSVWMNDPTVVGLPDVAQQEGRYLWLIHSGDGGLLSMQILDRLSGMLYEPAMPSEQVRLQQDLGSPPLTDDGRFLLCVGRSDDFYDYHYALIDAEAFLQGSTDYTPVTAPDL